jgi:hypothetical protein
MIELSTTLFVGSLGGGSCLVDLSETEPDRRVIWLN